MAAVEDELEGRTYLQMFQEEGTAVVDNHANGFSLVKKQSFRNGYGLSSRLGEIRRGIAGALALASALPCVAAQGVATSATAAWSSQIVAFWGAVGIGVRSSNGQQSSNAVTSAVAFVNARRRASAISAALRRSDWYLLAPGYLGGKTRMDVVLICWRTEQELASLATRVAALAETLGRFRWLVLVVGRKLQSNAGTGAFWTQSPRCEEFSVVRAANTNGVFAAFSDSDLGAFVTLQSAGTLAVDDIAAHIDHRRLRQSARSATRNEAPAEVQEATTIGRHVTSYQIEGGGTPYVAVEKFTAQYANSRHALVRCALWMYAIVHLTVAVAVALMGAASGRALAVWLFAMRIILSKLGAEAIVGDDMLLTLLAFDGLRYEHTTEPGSAALPGDASLTGSPWWHLLVAQALNAVELLLVVGGWLYGALKVQRLAPNGLVGHGMLWLATTVSLGLSVRTIFGVHKRVKGRLIGIFDEPYYVCNVIAHDCKIVVTSSPNPPASPPASPSPYVRLVAEILTKTQDDAVCVQVALALLRQPTFCSDVQQHAALHVLKYCYTGDTLSARGDLKTKVTTAGAYPWVQVSCCVALTASCAVFAAVYTYATVVPKYAKLVAEALLAISAMWFATLARTSKLPHNESSYTCHMIATMVASAVWYVGVEGVG